ncbi:hypothetical protein ECPA45_3308, partial [Escherichia coli PA45]
CQSTQKIT